MDSFDVVRELLLRNPEPTKEEALQIYEQLIDVYCRWKRVRVIAPSVQLGEKVMRLIRLVGLERAS